MAKWRKQKHDQQQPPEPKSEQDSKLDLAEQTGPDCATASETGPAPDPKPAGMIQVGQVWEGVIVPDRPVNILSLRPGAVLPPFVIDGPYTDGSGHWSAGFVGERGTKIRVDEEMLRTGRLRQ